MIDCPSNVNNAVFNLPVTLLENRICKITWIYTSDRTISPKPWHLVLVTQVDIIILSTYDQPQYLFQTFANCLPSQFPCLWDWFSDPQLGCIPCLRFLEHSNGPIDIERLVSPKDVYCEIHGSIHKHHNFKMGDRKMFDGLCYPLYHKLLDSTILILVPTILSLDARFFPLYLHYLIWRFKLWLLITWHTLVDLSLSPLDIWTEGKFIYISTILPILISHYYRILTVSVLDLTGSTPCDFYHKPQCLK